MDKAMATINTTPSNNKSVKTTTATISAGTTIETNTIGTNTLSSNNMDTAAAAAAAATATTTTSVVSSNTNLFLPRISTKNNPFSIVSHNNQTSDANTRTKATNAKFNNDRDDNDDDGDDNNIDNNAETDKNTRDSTTTTTITSATAQKKSIKLSLSSPSSDKPTMVTDFDSMTEKIKCSNTSCNSSSSLPRKFEKLNLNASTNTETAYNVTGTATSTATNTDESYSYDISAQKFTNKPDYEDHDDIDADVDEDDDLKKIRTQNRTQQTHKIVPKRVGVLQTKSEEDDRDEARGQLKIGMKHSKSELTASALNSPSKGMIPKIQATMDSRPIYPNVPYSPYGSPYGSPRSNRRRTPLRESRRISIEQSGSFLQLNQYKLMDQIGQGSYGLVKLAYSEEDSTHYAMKILSKRRLLRKAGLMGRGPKRTTSPLDRVYREIAVLKKLDHPNVVKLVEVLDDPLEDSLYLVFELVQQGEILSIPTDRPLSEERAWCVFRDALQGLEYLHYQRIIHADIKPGNLLLGECGRVKIADLGVCNEFLGEDAAMNNGSTAGTPAFRAPETLIPGQHLYSGKAADIWALGATLYALVYGNVPFVAKSVPALYEKIKHDQLKFPDYPKISNELRDLIEKILTKDPSKRITLPQIKEHNWVTSNGSHPLPSEEENCRLVQISDEDIHTVVKSIPKLDTLILIKTMLKNHSFQNPFSRGSISGRAPQRGGSRLERFTRVGRSNSAPGAYHLTERQLSSENILPSVSEGVASSCNESSDHSPDG